jgi:exodeoxyribonuclease X
MIVNWPVSIFVKPTVEISVGARSIHHISDKEAFSGVDKDTMAHFLIDGEPEAYAAHNAKVEEGYFSFPAPMICTYKCAAKFWPDAEKHTNQYLRYYLNLDMDKNLAHPPHRAAPDAYVTAHILRELLKKASIETLIEISKEPILLARVPFGKYRGLMWKEVDVMYLQWVLKQDFSEDVMHTASMELNRRTGRH